MPIAAHRRAPRQNKNAHGTEEMALTAFLARKSEIDSLLARLQALSDDHFGYHPDTINWGHVGTLEHYAEALKKVADAAFCEGEHAE